MPSEPADRIKTKKVHDGPAPNDGRRVLVERLWPRGVSKSAAALDAWEKQLAPSPELRKWYAHEPARWPEFKRRYREELMAQEEELDRLLEFAEQGPLTLVYSTQDRERNSATVLRDVLIERLKRES